MSRTDTGLYPALLRYWRARRGWSQLDLAVAADVSSRHVSFLETGRAQPGREMLLRSLFAWPGVPEAWRQPDFSAPSEAFLALRLRRGDDAMAFVTAITAFSAPGNVAVEELRIESDSPLDDVTAAACARPARG